MIVDSPYQMSLDMNLIRLLMMSLAGADVERGLMGYKDHARDYHEALLIEAELAHGNNTILADGRYMPIVICLTWEGQQFLNSIKDDSVWNGVKQRLSKIGAYTLPIIQTVAAEVIKSQLV